MRRRDYRCTNGHVSEYVDSMRDPIIRYLKCPTCGEPAERQIARGVNIGAIKGGEWVTDFPGGHTLTREEVERRLDQKPPDAFANDPGLHDRIADRVDRLMAQQDAGELKPSPELTPRQKDVLTKALRQAS